MNKKTLICIAVTVAAVAYAWGWTQGNREGHWDELHNASMIWQYSHLGNLPVRARSLTGSTEILQPSRDGSGFEWVPIEEARQR